jgi:hypothetical protein
MANTILLAFIALILGGIYRVLTKCALALEDMARIAKVRAQYYENFR